MDINPPKPKANGLTIHLTRAIKWDSDEKVDLDEKPLLHLGYITADLEKGEKLSVQWRPLPDDLAMIEDGRVIADSYEALSAYLKSYISERREETKIWKSIVDDFNGGRRMMIYRDDRGDPVKRRIITQVRYGFECYLEEQD